MKRPRATQIAIDPAGPATVRQGAHGGPTAVMGSSWRDPDDIRPTAARRAREITGWRTYCPLRRMIERGSHYITERHVLAADLFRGIVDLATIGYSAERDGTPVTAIVHGPRVGPSVAAVRQITARTDMDRALARFPAVQRLMLVEIVLDNHSLHRWCADREAMLGRRVNPDIEMGKLSVVLDLLADHYSGEIDEQIAEGRLI